MDSCVTECKMRKGWCTEGGGQHCQCELLGLARILEQHMIEQKQIYELDFKVLCNRKRGASTDDHNVKLVCTMLALAVKMVVDSL